MAFDSQRGVVVLQTYVSQTSGQTWEWNGTNWMSRGLGGPSQVRHGAMAYDSVRNVTVQFGGTSDLARTNALLGGDNQTWEWDGTTWNNTLASPAPPGRCKHAMVFDPVRGQSLVFGGFRETSSGSAVYQDTWVWDGSSWAQRNPVSRPSPRHGHAMAYDTVRQRTVLFGGTTRYYQYSNPNLTFNDTWEWDGTNWFERFPANAPSPRQEAAVVFDARSGQTLLFGGIDRDGNVLGDLWSWDGNNWRQLATAASPARRYDAAMVFDVARGVILLFGGSNYDYTTYLRDTWEYTAGTTGSYVPYGSGCAGSRGAPTLAARPGSLPIASQQFFAQVTNLPLTAPAYMFLGVSRTAYGSLPLPLDLSVIGMPGCHLYASGELLFGVTNILGSGLWSFDVPASLAGLRFYNQVIALDPTANSLGLIVSNAAEALVGN